MIVVNLKGGLGNQMFQYACGRAIALRCERDGHPVDLRVSLRNLPPGGGRRYALEPFAICAEVATDKETARIKYPYGVFSKGWRLFAGRILKRYRTVAFDPAVCSWRDDVFVDGYWQTEKYFSDCTEAIRADFTLTKWSEEATRVRSLIATDEGSVSLHVRRGDYVGHPEFGGICDNGYYERAIARICGSVPDAHFYVFSNDIAWVKANISLGDAVTFISTPGISDQEEVMLMSECRAHIIANSSFSWWGAWLDPRPHPLVIAPIPWARTDDDRFRDIVPPSWLRI